MAPNPPTATCRACGEQAPAGATRCEACGYDVAEHHRARLVLGAVGTVLTLSVVLAPVGLPLLWRAYRHRLLAEGTVAAGRSTPLGVHLREVVRLHLGLAPAPEPRADVPRAGAVSGRER